MNTFKEIVYLIADELKISADDSFITNEHIIYLLGKHRSLILQKTYKDNKKLIPESNYQTLCLSLEKNKQSDDDCSNVYLVSTEAVPTMMPVGNSRLTPLDFSAGEITYVNKDRFKYVGFNKFLQNIIYFTQGPDKKLYLKSNNPQAYYLEKVQYTGIFEDIVQAAKLGNPDLCDILDAEFPMEEALIPVLVESIVRELLGMAYRPADQANNAKDDFSDMMSYIRNAMKKDKINSIE